MNEDKKDKKISVEPPVGSWASVAREMAKLFPNQPGEPPFDWDAWKDEMKERAGEDDI